LHQEDKFDYMNLPKESIKEISLHKKIKLKSNDISKLYLSRLFKCCKTQSCWKDQRKLNTLYENG
jgi:hypothetical protein